MPFPPSKRKRRRFRGGAATLSLTSLMDVFVIILLFLLKSYAIEGDLLAADPNIKLPVSTSTQAPQLRLILQVTKDEIMVDGVKVSAVDEVLAREGFLIEPLLKVLDKHARKTEFIAQRNEELRFTGEILIQGDRRIPFLLLEKIMFTSGQAGYNNISLAVSSSE